MPPLQNIVIGQKVSSRMYETARELRHNMTEAETILWQHLRANRLDGFHFRRQQIIGKYVADFYCHAASLVVELEGEIHEQRVEHDAEREADLTGRGLLILRFKNDAVIHDLGNVLARITSACRARTSPSLPGKGLGDRSL